MIGEGQGDNDERGETVMDEGGKMMVFEEGMVVMVDEREDEW